MQNETKEQTLSFGSVGSLSCHQNIVDGYWIVQQHRKVPGRVLTSG
jgi:hypothetical protein